MTIRLRRTLCLVSGAVMLVGLHGCRHRECRSRSCEIGSYYGHAYEQPSYDLYAAESTGPMLPPPSPAPTPADTELPPPIPQTELAPPNRSLIQPRPAVPSPPAGAVPGEPARVPPAILPEPVPPEPAEPAADDSPFKGAMRSAREKVSRLFHRPHASTGQPVIRSSSSSSRVRQVDAFPRSAGIQSPHTTDSTDDGSRSMPVSARVAVTSEHASAVKRPQPGHDRVADDFVSPWADTAESIADRESLDLDAADEFETAPIEIPIWPSLAARHPLGTQAASASRDTDVARPVPVGTWVRIAPRVNSAPAASAVETDDVSVETQHLQRLESPCPLLVPPKAER